MAWHFSVVNQSVMIWKNMKINVLFWNKTIYNSSFPQLLLFTSSSRHTINASWIFELKYFKNFVRFHIVHSYHSIALATSTLSFSTPCAFYWSTSNIYCFFIFLQAQHSCLSHFPTLLSSGHFCSQVKRDHLGTRFSDEFSVPPNFFFFLFLADLFVFKPVTLWIIPAWLCFYLVLSFRLLPSKLPRSATVFPFSPPYAFIPNPPPPLPLCMLKYSVKDGSRRGRWGDCEAGRGGIGGGGGGNIEVKSAAVVMIFWSLFLGTSAPLRATVSSTVFTGSWEK